MIFRTIDIKKWKILHNYLFDDIAKVSKRINITGMSFEGKMYRNKFRQKTIFAVRN